MPVIVPSDCLQVSMHMTSNDASGEIVNVFGVSNASAIDADAAAEAVYGVFCDSFADFQSNNITYTGCTVRGPVGGVEGSFAGARTGAVSGTMAPINTCALLKKVTGISGKKFRGRMYLAGVPEASRLGSNLTLAAQTQLAIHANDFRGNLATTADLPLVILHSTTIPASLVTNLFPELRLATQRGRLRD